MGLGVNAFMHWSVIAALPQTGNLSRVYLAFAQQYVRLWQPRDPLRDKTETGSENG